METWRQKVERKTKEEKERRLLVSEKTQAQKAQAEKTKAEKAKAKAEKESLEQAQSVNFVDEENAEPEVPVRAKRSSSSEDPLNSTPQTQAQQQTSVKPSTSSYAGLTSAKKRKKSPDKEPMRAKKHSPENSERSGSTGDSNEDVEQAVPSRYAPIRKKRREKEAEYTKRSIVEIHSNNGKPAWYPSGGRPSKRAYVLDLQAVNDIIQRCISAGEKGEDATEHVTELREQLHKMEFWPWLTQRIVMESKVLEGKGLKRIFTEPHQARFPFDIKADAFALHTRWYMGEVTSELLRGVSIEKGVTVSGQHRRTYSLNKEYVDRKVANVVGSNDLVNGQWWPIRICAIRDGAHGEQEAGISGKTGHGAYSVVVASGGYDDKDNGEAIEYCGTESDRPTPTKHTQLMLDSQTKKLPVRVLRSKNKKNKFAPKDGLRYDGLYDIVAHEILSAKTAMYRFSLRRQEGQDPIRYRGPEARPTIYELKEKKMIQHLVSNIVI